MIEVLRKSKNSDAVQDSLAELGNSAEMSGGNVTHDSGQSLSGASFDTPKPSAPQISDPDRPARSPQRLAAVAGAVLFCVLSFIAKGEAELATFMTVAALSALGCFDASMSRTNRSMVGWMAFSLSVLARSVPQVFYNLENPGTRIRSGYDVSGALLAGLFVLIALMAISVSRKTSYLSRFGAGAVIVISFGVSAVAAATWNYVPDATLGTFGSNRLLEALGWGVAVAVFSSAVLMVLSAKTLTYKSIPIWLGVFLTAVLIALTFAGVAIGIAWWTVVWALFAIAAWPFEPHDLSIELDPRNFHLVARLILAGLAGISVAVAAGYVTGQARWSFGPIAAVVFAAASGVAIYRLGSSSVFADVTKEDERFLDKVRAERKAGVGRIVVTDFEAEEPLSFEALRGTSEDLESLRDTSFEAEQPPPIDEDSVSSVVEPLIAPPAEPHIEGSIESTVEPDAAPPVEPVVETTSQDLAVSPLDDMVETPESTDGLLENAAASEPVEPSPKGAFSGSIGDFLAEIEAVDEATFAGLSSDEAAGKPVVEPSNEPAFELTTEEASLERSVAAAVEPVAAAVEPVAAEAEEATQLAGREVLETPSAQPVVEAEPARVKPRPTLRPERDPISVVRPSPSRSSLIPPPPSGQTQRISAPVSAAPSEPTTQPVPAVRPAESALPTPPPVASEPVAPVPPAPGPVATEPVAPAPAPTEPVVPEPETPVPPVASEPVPPAPAAVEPVASEPVPPVPPAPVEPSSQQQPSDVATASQSKLPPRSPLPIAQPSTARMSRPSPMLGLLDEGDFDPVTGLVNPAGLQRILTTHLDTYRQSVITKQGTPHAYGTDALLLITIRNNVEIEKVHGRVFTETLLRTAALRAAAASSGAVTSRFASNAVSVLLANQHMTNTQVVQQCTQLVQALLREFAINGVSVKLDATAGVALRAQGEPLAKFVERANQALIRAAKTKNPTLVVAP